MNPVLAAIQSEWAGAMASMRRFYTMHLYGDGFPRCRVPHAGRCPESLLDAWDLYDTGPPDTTCLCEGGVCHG